MYTSKQRMYRKATSPAFRGLLQNLGSSDVMHALDKFIRAAGCYLCPGQRRKVDPGVDDVERSVGKHGMPSAALRSNEDHNQKRKKLGQRVKDTQSCKAVSDWMAQKSLYLCPGDVRKIRHEVEPRLSGVSPADPSILHPKLHKLVAKTACALRLNRKQSRMMHEIIACYVDVKQRKVGCLEYMLPILREMLADLIKLDAGVTTTREYIPSRELFKRIDIELKRLCVSGVSPRNLVRCQSGSRVAERCFDRIADRLDPAWKITTRDGKHLKNKINRRQLRKL